MKAVPPARGVSQRFTKDKNVRAVLGNSNVATKRREAA